MLCDGCSVLCDGGYDYLQCVMKGDICAVINYLESCP